jgi:hypothetical protein
MAEDPKTFKLAEHGIKQSPIYETLKLKILAAADPRTRLVPKAHQVSLMKLGRYTDNGWRLLRNSMQKYVDLAGASTVRGVCSTYLFFAVVVSRCCT